MYSVKRLEYPEWRKYEHFTFPYLRQQLEAPAPEVLAFGAAILGQPAGLLLARENAQEPGMPEIQSIFVDPNQRRVGIASSLLHKAEEQFRQQQRLGAGITYIDSGTRTRALERLLQKLEWDAPALRTRICESDFVSITRAPWMARREFPAGYEVFQWTNLTAAEREDIVARQQKQPWYPEQLSPFSREEHLEPIGSLGLRYRGEIVGWCITHRGDGEGVLYFARLFVREDLQIAGRAVNLLARSIYQHEHTTEFRTAVFEVSGKNTRMLGFLDRRLAPYMKSMRNLMRQQKSFTAARPVEMAA
jgi:GNAT superfamily N-acetyltransferase